MYQNLAEQIASHIALSHASSLKTHIHIQAFAMAPKVAEKAVKAPATKAPAAKKVVKKATAGASKKKVKAVESYKIYIYKVLKQVGPGISNEAAAALPQNSEMHS